MSITFYRTDTGEEITGSLVRVPMGSPFEIRAESIYGNSITWFSSTSNNTVYLIGDGSTNATGNTLIITPVSIGRGIYGIYCRDGVNSIHLSVEVYDPNYVYIPVTSLSIDISTLEISVGESYKIPVTIAPSNATNQKVLYSKDFEQYDGIISLSSDGTVIGLSEGIVVIKATSDDNSELSDTVAIKVVAIVEPSVPVTGITIDPTSMSLNVGETNRIFAVIKPSGASNKEVYWYSNDTNIAIVDSVGNVTAVSGGTTYITAETEDGGYKAFCVVSVVEEETIKISLNVSNPLQLTYEKDQYVNVKATVTPTPTTAPIDTTVTFSLLENNGVVEFIASVGDPDNQGFVHPLKAGTAILRITSDHNSSVYVDLEIIVSEKTPELITSITFPSPSYTNMVKAEYTIEPTISPENADNSLNWSSANENIVSVVPIGNGSSAKITLNHRGTVTITATAADSGGVSASVTVEAKPRPCICKTDGTWAMATAFCNLEEVLPEIF